MKLHAPFVITSRLLPGIHFRDCANALSEISIEICGETRDGRSRYRYHIDTPGFTHTGSDLKSGVGGGSLVQGMVSLLSFLAACAEAWSYKMKFGGDGDNCDLFPVEVAQWATNHSDELSVLQLEIEESEADLIED